MSNIEFENIQEMQTYGYLNFIDLYNHSQRRKKH